MDVLDMRLCNEVVMTCAGVLLGQGQAPQRKCAGLLSTTLRKEVEGVRQQEEQEDKRDEEKRDKVNGEVEEIAHRAHET